MNKEQEELKQALRSVAARWLEENYPMLWLISRLEKGKQVQKNGTLITGSSYGLTAINASYFENCINCSMHSQDLYYDFLCAKKILEDGNKNAFSKAVLVWGYWTPYYDLSMSKTNRENMIPSIYYPIFQDAHNWSDPREYDVWERFGEVPSEVKEYCELLSRECVKQKDDYYTMAKRNPVFDLKGRSWHELPLEEKERMGEKRAKQHNEQKIHMETFPENCDILKDYVHLLHLHSVLPIITIAPFTQYYNKYIDHEYKNSIMEMLGKIQETVHFIDMNESNCFDDFDFFDTDHCSEIGANKVSYMLKEIISEIDAGF